MTRNGARRALGTQAGFTRILSSPGVRPTSLIPRPPPLYAPNFDYGPVYKKAAFRTDAIRAVSLANYVDSGNP